MSHEDRALWATNFHGPVAETGFLVLDAEAPLRLTAAGEHAGPELQFWSRSGRLQPPYSALPRQVRSIP